MSNSFHSVYILPKLELLIEYQISSKFFVYIDDFYEYCIKV